MAKKITALLMALLLLGSVVTAVAAGGGEITPYASDYLDGCFITTTPEGNLKICVDYTVYGTRQMTELGATKVQIQRYQNGDWVNHVALAGSSTKNDVSHTASVSFYGAAGQKYRAVIYAYAKNSNGSDSRAYDGSGVYCKP